MNYKNNILELIGETPLVKINKLAQGMKPLVLAKIESLRGILSPGLIGSFVLLGLFPLIAKKIVDAVQARQVYAPWAKHKPKTFDRTLVVKPH